MTPRQEANLQRTMKIRDLRMIWCKAHSGLFGAWEGLEIKQICDAELTKLEAEPEGVRRKRLRAELDAAYEASRKQAIRQKFG